MNLFKGGAKKKLEDTEQPLVDPDGIPQPKDAAEFLRRGYAYYARGRFPEAEADFKKAIELETRAVDAVYALGMALKAQKRPEEAVQTFQKAIELIDSGVIDNRVRANMLRRLAKGHINEIKEGDWNLEKEMWRRVE